MDIKANSHELEKRIRDALAVLAEKNPGLAAAMLWHGIEVRMSARLQRCVGRVKFWRQRDVFLMEFSASLFAQLSDHMKTDTVIHELAHIICFRTGRGDGHCSGWKSVCRDMNGSGERLINAAMGTVKKNLISRLVVVDKCVPTKLHLVTSRGYAKLMQRSTQAQWVSLGRMRLNPNDGTYRWVHVVQELSAHALLDLAILDRAKWRLVS
jgi:hypothetical protein